MTSHFMAITPAFEKKLDEGLASLSCFSNAEEEKYAPMLPQDFILASNYIKSFPQHGFTVGNSIQEGEKYLLSPTCCYPVFNGKRGTRVSGETLITHKNMCFRCEEYYEPGTRQISFLMREYIMFSSDLTRVTAWIDDVKKQVYTFISSLGLKAEVLSATDPFFNAEDYKQKFQKDQNLKSEFVVDDIAVASVNLHLRAFANACDIKAEDGKPLYTACFGMGYDRMISRVAAAEARSLVNA